MPQSFLDVLCNPQEQQSQDRMSEESEETFDDELHFEDIIDEEDD